VSPTDQRPVPLRILIVEDDEDDYFIISNYIKDIPGQDFQTEWCSEYQQALGAIQNSDYSLYFIDYYLTGKTGLDLLKEAMIDAVDAPIIMLTGKANAVIDRNAMQLGASDYLIKSELNAEKLERCIRYSLERAANLKELRESERQYRNIFERTNDVFFIADAQLKITKVNDAASQIFGYSHVELINMALPDLFAQDEDKERVKLLLSRKGRVDDYQVALKTKGAGKVGLISVSFETGLRGRRYAQGIIHEITLLKRTEEIRIQMEKLEAKGRVIRTLAHEVRNPLNNIQLSVENLRSSDRAQTFEYLEIIERNSQRINDLINDLMDSTRFDKMNLEEISLQAVMNDAIRFVQDRLTLNNVILDITYSPVAAMVFVDREKLVIAFLNLITNAIEAMDGDNSRIGVSVTTKPDFHEVKIEDNGCGMTANTAQKLFDPYFTTKPNGLGLGLATTHAILVSHKATIAVSSEVSKGTVFTLAFPALSI
jgi:two-component system, sporulation sensor kinase E